VYDGPGRPKVAYDSPFHPNWQQRMIQWISTCPLAVIPPRLAMPSCPETAFARSVAWPLINSMRGFFVHIRPVRLFIDGGLLLREYDALCFLLVNKCHTLQLHPSEAIAIHYRFMTTGRYGEIRPDYWQNDLVRHVHFHGLSLRQWMYDNVRTLAVSDLRRIGELVCPNLQFDAITYTVYRNDTCPGNCLYERRPVTVDWASVWESPTLTFLYMGSYFPPPSVLRPTGNIVHSLFKYEVELRQPSVTTLMHLFSDMREKYIDMVRTNVAEGRANVYEYVDIVA